MTKKGEVLDFFVILNVFFAKNFWDCQLRWLLF